jgi:hypothetical protein
MVLDSGWHRVGLLPRSTVCTIVLLCFGKVLQHAIIIGVATAQHPFSFDAA